MSIGAVALVAGAAIAARAVAVRELPPDYDEVAYISAAYWYAERMAPGHWRELSDEPENAEHPPMVKLLYALEFRLTGAPEPEWELVSPGEPLPEAARPAFLQARALSAAAGVLQAALLAVVAPMGGLWLAVDTYHVKFTSEAYIEALPGLLALLSVLLFERALRRREPPAGTPAPVPEALRPGPLLAAAACLGLAAAGKYAYGLVLALTMAPFLLTRARHQPGALLGFAAVVLAVFLAANPALWPDPLGRLWSSVGFHFHYAVDDNVRSFDLPWWQPLAWLSRPAPAVWHPGVFLVSFPDRLILAVAAVSAPAAWRRRPVWVAWSVVGLAFLLVWPTKWPQYTLMVRAGLAGCAGIGLAVLWDRVRSHRDAPEG
jgi:hypothetical protein